MAVIYKQTVENLSERRIDAWHYQPNFQNQINKIKQNVGVIFLNDVIDKSRGVASGATPLGANYLQNGKVKFYRTSEIEGMFLDSEKAVYISEEDDEKLARSRLKAGDILLTITGAKFGKSAVVSELHLPGNISQHSVRFHPKPELIDSYFLVAYLESNIGQDVIWREAYGATRPAIDFPSVRALTLPKVNLITQKYIGDKVRQAEQLKTQIELIKKIPIFIDAILRNIIPENINVLFEKIKYDKLDALNILKDILTMSNGDKQFIENFSILAQENLMGSVDTERENFHINMVSINAIEDFLSAQTYRPAVTDAYKRVLDNSSSLSSLCSEPIRQGATPHFSEKGFKCLKSRQTRELFIEDEGYETVNPLHEKNQRIEKLKFGDIIVTRQGAGTVGRASLFLEEEECYITDSLFLIRADPNQCDSAFIAAYLRSYTGQRLLEKGVYGSTGQLNLSSKSLRNLPVFNFDRDIQNFLGDQIRFGYKLDKYKNKLIKISKFLTEALIEGLISEEELIQAQNALEQGDTSLDRVILSQMTEDGYAVAGSKPLFADLDEFYALLEQAKALE